MDRLQKGDRAWDGQDRDPRTFGELGNDYYSERDCRGDRTNRVDPEMRMMCGGSTRCFLVADHSPPMHGHACLRQCEGQESADGK
jgi:hypothetical protein